MIGIIRIRDLSAPELDVFSRCSENQLRHYYEPLGGLFIAESEKVVERALRASCKPVSLLVEERLAELPLVQKLLPLCPVYVSSYETLKQLVGYSLTGGMLCAMMRPELPSCEELLTPSVRRIAVLENVTNPTNTGAIFRSAAAMGVDAVLVSSGSCDPLYRRSIRVSMGTVFQIPWTVIHGLPDVSVLKNAGFLTAAMALVNDSLPIDDHTLKIAERLALFLGSEGYGLTEELIRNCDCAVKIPMAEGIDSLNVAAAAAVAFWETRAGQAHNAGLDFPQENVTGNINDI